MIPDEFRGRVAEMLKNMPPGPVSALMRCGKLKPPQVPPAMDGGYAYFTVDEAAMIEDKLPCLDPSLLERVRDQMSREALTKMRKLW